MRALEALLFEAGVINDFNEERIRRIAQARKARGLDDIYLNYVVDLHQQRGKAGDPPRPKSCKASSEVPM